MTGRGSWPEPRAFTGKQRVDLYLKADGNCQLCGVELKARWHADHVVPWSAGGETSNENGQALCPQCNMTKGSTMQSGKPSWIKHELREWQKLALSLALQKFVEADTNFLCDATPGAGKTTFGAKLGRALLDNKAVTQIMVVSPSVNVRNGWAEAFHKEGIPLDPTWSGADTVWKSDTNRMHYGDAPDYYGPSVTYNALASAKRVLNWHCQKHPTLVIIDEVHHAAESKTWGLDLSEAFGSARNRLLLSGTAFRHDNNRIQWIDYEKENGFYISRPDIVYGYKEALRDKVARPIYFSCIDSLVEYSVNGQVHKSSISDESEEVQSARLTAALTADGPIVRDFVLRADRDLTHMRLHGHPNAQVLAICTDVAHAEKVCDVIRKETGASAMLVHSLLPNAHTIIDNFKRSDCRWLVSVAMVSEGVDIPNFRALVWLSTISTKLAHYQAYGRVLRWMNELGPRQDAIIYMPDDPRFVSIAREIALQRDDVIREKTETDEERLTRYGQPMEHARTRFEGPILIEATDTHMSRMLNQEVIIDGADIERVQAAGQHLGVTLSPSVAHDLVRINRHLGITPDADGAPRTVTPKEVREVGEVDKAPLHRLKDKARQEITRLVKAIALKCPEETEYDIRLAMYHEWDNQRITDASLTGLNERIAWCQKRLRASSHV